MVWNDNIFSINVYVDYRRTHAIFLFLTFSTDLPKNRFLNVDSSFLYNSIFFSFLTILLNSISWSSFRFFLIEFVKRATILQECFHFLCSYKCWDILFSLDVIDCSFVGTMKISFIFQIGIRQSWVMRTPYRLFIGSFMRIYVLAWIQRLQW